MFDSMLHSILSAAYLSAILRVTTPILLPALGALISERAGVINIGLEGIMLWAAFTGATVGAYTGSAAAGLVAGCGVAIAVALLLGFFHLHLHGDLILGGVAINILGSAGTVAIGFALTGSRSGETPNLASVQMPILDLVFLKNIPAIGDGLYTAIGAQNSLTWIALGAVIALWFLLYRTPFGNHLRAVGEAPDAAASVGIPVRRVRYLALALSGLLAGLGGIHLSMGYLSLGFQRDMTAGRGFIALVAPVLGGATPLGTALASLLFGTFAALETRLGTLAIPPQIPQMIPYAATLLVLILYSILKVRRERRIFAQE
jgi:simple sugar transport system permease protein